MSWNTLNRTYEKAGIFLALGAGVSIGSSLPNWTELLRRLCYKLLVGQAEFADLQRSGFSLPAIAALLKGSCSQEGEFSRHVREALYTDFPFFPGGVSKSNHSEFVRHVRAKNSTLRSVASLCAEEIRARVYGANPRIHAVVTFNLDSLLQAYIYARYRKRLVRTIERPSASRRPEKINVYHMHGFLRFDRKWNDPKKGAADKLVLSEHEYFDFFNSPTSLFNYTFLHLLREYSCVFLGLSLQDDNIRRLLHYSKLERMSAFLEEGVEAEKAEAKSQRHFAILARSDYPKLDRLVASSLRSLGTQALWIQDYSEIPNRLGEMYENAGSKWQTVY